LGHAPGNIQFSLISGPLVQTGDRTFKLQSDRGGINAQAWIQAEHPGNEEYRAAVQPARVIIPAAITNGNAQKISFPFKQVYNYKTRKIPLHASSSSGLPVSYYVVAGPAYVKGNNLILTTIPKWSSFPIKITVVAYQWGSLQPPFYQSAQPAIALYYIKNEIERKNHPIRDQIIIDLLLNYLLRSL
jgi:hypothetical protein